MTIIREEEEVACVRAGPLGVLLASRRKGSVAVRVSDELLKPG